MDHNEALAAKLRSVDYDRSRLTDDQCVEVYRLARAAKIELWRPGLVWPSSDSADLRGGAVTRIEPRP